MCDTIEDNLILKHIINLWSGVGVSPFVAN